jgi:hypothetical protein
MYQNVQCTIGNRNFPDEPFETLGARFLQFQMIASDLDGPIEPTVEYINSLTRSKNNTNSGARLTQTSTDESSFMINVQLERSGAGYCFDGLDSHGQNLSIQLKGGPIWSGTDDTYYCYEAKSASASTLEDYKHPIPPQVWICQETYWRLSVERGMEYMKTDNPPGTQADF